MGLCFVVKFLNMSSNKKEVSSESLRLIIPECACCKRTIVKNTTKCNSCHKSYHPGCANKIKKCCDYDFSSSTDYNAGNSSPMSDITDKSNITSESTHQQLLMKIIYELEAKNSLLVENNSLLRFKISTLEDVILKKNAEIDKLKKETDNKIINKHVGESSSCRPSGNESVSDSVTDVPGSSGTTRVPHLYVADAEVSTHAGSILKHSKQNVLNKTGMKVGKKSEDKTRSQTDNTQVTQPTVLNRNEDWNVVSHKRSFRKRKQTLVVGNCSENLSVEGIGRFSIFHVTNLKPETTEKNLQEFLVQKFSFVQCEKLTSRYPKSYSSFKVLIPSSEYEKALNGSNWPNNANIHRFFHPKRTNRPTD